MMMMMMILSYAVSYNLEKVVNENVAVYKDRNRMKSNVECCN